MNQWYSEINKLNQQVFFFLPTGVILLLICPLLFSCTMSNPKLEIGVNEIIHYDDFEYSVTDYSVVKLIEDDLKPGHLEGSFYIVDFQAKNYGLMVNHKWENSIAYIIDTFGNIYENEEALQKELNEFNNFGWQENEDQIILNLTLVFLKITIFIFPPVRVHSINSSCHETQYFSDSFAHIILVDPFICPDV